MGFIGKFSRNLLFLVLDSPVFERLHSKGVVHLPPLSSADMFRATYEKLYVNSFALQSTYIYVLSGEKHNLYFFQVFFSRLL